MHSQAALKDQFAKFGVEVEDDILGFEVPITDTAADIRRKADAVIDIVLCGDAQGILVGGLSSSTYYLIVEAFETRCEESEGLRVFEAMFCPLCSSMRFLIEADMRPTDKHITERIRDENDRFVFVLKGVREIL